MITHYKGIDLEKNSDIKNYIATYHVLDRDNYQQYLDNDKALQEIIRLHNKKNKAIVFIINIMFYVTIALLIKVIT